MGSRVTARPFAYIISPNMGKVEDYRRELSQTSDRVALLRAGSNLPGPRGNLELMFAAAAEGSEAELRQWLELGFPAEADGQPTDEFLAMCGIVGLGRLVAGGRPEFVEELRSYAADRRWRVREAVAMALQTVGDADMSMLLDITAQWLDDRPYVQRAAVAAVSEPRLLRDPAGARAAIDVVDAATLNLIELDDRRSDEARTLRQALAYCWSVVVAAEPVYGRQRFEVRASIADKDVLWLLCENLKKSRLARLDPVWTATMQGRVCASGGRS